MPWKTKANVAEFEKVQPASAVALRPAAQTLCRIAAGLGCATLVTLAAVPSAARAQLRVDTQPIHRLGGDAMLWNGVIALDAHDSLLVVLTESDPVLHQFSLSRGDHIRSWGEAGEGPGEFRSSADVVLVGGQVYALDTTQRRVSVFDLTGRLQLTTPVTGLGLPYANRLEHASGDTMVIRAYAPMGDANALVAWTVEGVAGTVLSFDDPPEELRLEAPGAPGLTLRPPFSPYPRWTVVSGQLVYWPAHGEELQIVGLDGTQTTSIVLPIEDRFEITAGDREWWFRTGIPTEFRGRRPFEPLRRVARQTVDFPPHQPLVLELLGAPNGAVWVKRQTSLSDESRGQVWDVVDREGGFVDRITLPVGHLLMAVLAEHVVIRTTTELGSDVVQVHRLLPAN
ncbi:MAG: hypothetical protein F4205_14915 [Gemmatimonadetes bacterium]|nr:hypothetical protein [Gemmatimonadota bacterium]MYC91042.1 hypothetical protein [Gemmatimonadota bacterium]MYG36774.1 hypothetical protein [Gemmatimonadota bacterium]